MKPLRCYVELPRNMGIGRMAELVREGVVSDYYVRLGRGYDENLELWPEAAREVRAAGGKLWAWQWCEADQTADVQELERWELELDPDGYLLNVELPLAFANLGTLAAGATKFGKPVCAVIAGRAPQAPFDFRTLDRYGIEVEWECYVDSGEGQPPDEAVTELCRVSRVHIGKQYRHVIGSTYGWGEIADDHTFASYNKKARYYLELEFNGLVWPPYVVKDRRLYDQTDWSEKGMLLGQVAYSRIRVALDTTRTAQQNRDLTGWTNLAASARLKGASVRGISVYLGEVTPDDVFAAIQRGASA